MFDFINILLLLNSNTFYTKMEEFTIIAPEYFEVVNSINTVWVALCAALIFFMEAGFAILEAGFVRSKNAMSIIAKVIIDIIFGGIAFFIFGFTAQITLFPVYLMLLHIALLLWLCYHIVCTIKEKMRQCLYA